MSGAVDVSGILERSGANPNAVEGTQAWALAQVDAAVAELIKAAEQAHAFLSEKAPATATEYRLRCALARCKGGAA